SGGHCGTGSRAPGPISSPARARWYCPRNSPPMNLALVLSYIAVVVMLIATPGPVVALVMSTAAASGPRRAVMTAFGATCASLVLITAAALVISGAAVLEAETLRWISIAGCLYIAWLSIGTIRRHATERADDDTPRVRPGGGLRGLFVGLPTPTNRLCYVAWCPQFIQVTTSFAAWIAVYSIVCVGVVMLILGGFIMRVSRFLSPSFKHMFTMFSS